MKYLMMQMWRFLLCREIQLICFILSLWTDSPGRSINNLCQGTIVAITANPDSVVSPPLVLALGTIAFLVSMVDIIIEIYIPRARVEGIANEV
jgi:hypothetical protein